jgi:LacI family transcriptional regulator, gluconate utilization system Gnt-I transcriptional repressor
LQGLPRQLATMDACRAEIGNAAARIILNDTLDEPDPDLQTHVTMTPTLSLGDTLRRKRSG